MKVTLELSEECAQELISRMKNRGRGVDMLVKYLHSQKPSDQVRSEIEKAVTAQNEREQVIKTLEKHFTPSR